MKQYNVIVPADAPAWALRLQSDFNRVFGAIARDIHPANYLKANLPTNGSEKLAIVTDEVGGSVLAFFDGTNWRRVTDRAVVS